MRKIVKIRTLLMLIAVFSLAACKMPVKPQITDDTIVSSTVNGVTLSYRHAIQPPTNFTPINQEYRALYGASIMTTPGYNGKQVHTLTAGEAYTVLGDVGEGWYAIAESADHVMVGYVPARSVVESDKYDATLRADRPRRRHKAGTAAAGKKKDCVNVGADGQACRKNSNSTWILN
jgi:hypothetical protein